VRLNLLEDTIKYAAIIEAVTEKKYKSGLADTADLYNARALVAQYKINYESLASQKAAVEAGIETLLGNGVQPETGDFETVYSEADRFEFSVVPFAGTQSAEIYRLTRENYIYTMDVNENKLLPELDIVGKYTRKSGEDEFSASLTVLDKSDYYIGFTASYPLWNTEAESNVKESEIAIKEINTEYKITENAYNTNVETLMRQNEGYKRMIDLSGTRIKLLEARYNTVYKKYRQGNQSLQEVIDALQDITTEKTVLFKYKSSLIQGYIDYTDLTR
jgi:outer membrane protein TolC